jgi:hypothetical protein
MTNHVKEPPEPVHFRAVRAGAHEEKPHFLEVIDEILNNSKTKRWPAGTTDRLLAEDRDRPY